MTPKLFVSNKRQSVLKENQSEKLIENTGKQQEKHLIQNDILRGDLLENSGMQPNEFMIFLINNCSQIR